MDKYSENILKVNTVICSNIDKRAVLADDGLLAQNVLAQLRNFTEAIAIKIYSIDHSVDINQSGTKNAIQFIKSQDDLVFLQRFHKLLEFTDSHITVEPDAALRLMWRYYDYLIECKNYLKKHFDLDVLLNIDAFPLEEDQTLKEYYEKIAEKIDQESTVPITESPTNRFYIVKKKLFRVNGQKYYEITMIEADNKTNKFDRLIAFTKLNIPTYYAVHLKLSDSKISIINRNMPIRIINGFKVSIRPCEIKNFFKLFGYTIKDIKSLDKEYLSLMSYLTNTRRNLLDILDLDNEDFTKLKQRICEGIRSTPIFIGIELCRALRGKPGYNVLAYLIYRLNNLVLKAQTDNQPNAYLSNLYLKYACIPFDQMPYANNPKHFNTVLYDLYHSIDPVGRQHELLARKIKMNTEIGGQLYTPISELKSFESIQDLIAQYNNNLYWKHKENSSLKLENGYVFISGYENDSLYIIRKLLRLTEDAMKDYGDSVNQWLNQSGYIIDDDSKKQVLKNMFASSKVALIYGSAGTGKSTMIKHISNYFRDKNKIFLANTHAAIENLKRNVGHSDTAHYHTIASFKLNNVNKNCDVLFIDECSTVSNADMAQILRETDFECLVLVGDIYQIESIKFGNWFYMAKTSVSSKAVFELNYIHRSAEQELLTLWKSVRKLDGRMADILELNHFCASLDESIFEKMEEDEIVLCLNYDGLYGINNINKFLQDNNNGQVIQLGIERYKAGDPVVFKETVRFGEYLYNNLKGKIIAIQELEKSVKFFVEVYTVFDALEVKDAPFVLEQSLPSGKSVISFEVDRFENKDDDDKADSNIVPFQVAYAVSIHKAQGLEYDSVKIIITDEVEELISHNIFYTAITRAKKKLKIYWTKRSEQYVLDKMHFMSNKKDASILTGKFKLKG